MSNIRVVTSGDRGAVTPENGELLFESDTGRLLVYYQGVYHKYNLTGKTNLTGDQEHLHYTDGLFDQLDARYRLDVTPVLHHDAMFVNGVDQTNNPPHDTNVNYRGMYDTHGYGVWRNRVTSKPQHDIYMGAGFGISYTDGQNYSAAAGLMTYMSQDEVMPYFKSTTADSNGDAHVSGYGEGVDWGGVTPSVNNLQASMRVPIYQATDTMQPLTFVIVLKHGPLYNGTLQLTHNGTRAIIPHIKTTANTSPNPLQELVGVSSHTRGDQRYTFTHPDHHEFPGKWESWKQVVNNRNTISMYMVTYDGVQQSSGVGPYYDVYTRGGIRFDSNRPGPAGGYTEPGSGYPQIHQLGGRQWNKIFEMMLFEQVLTTSQMNTIIAYVNNRYSMDFVPVES